MRIPLMTHFGVGTAQVIITVIFLIGYFGCAVMEGLGWFKVSIINNLREVLVLVMSFWFMRQRTSVETTAQEDDLKRNPTLPAQTPVNQLGVTKT